MDNGSYFGFDTNRQDLEVRFVLGVDNREREQPGVKELREAVRILDGNREEFNTEYSAEELLQIVRMHRGELGGKLSRATGRGPRRRAEEDREGLRLLFSTVTTSWDLARLMTAVEFLVGRHG